MRFRLASAASTFLVGAALTLTAASVPATLTFERVVTPFAVLDDRGQTFALPFLGGLDVPRPQFVDIDGDGDLDLFLQEYPNTLWFFENTGTLAAPKYVWKTDSYQDLDVGEWSRFVDIDADGDIDLIAEQPFSNIRLYRNAGTKTEARFAAAETLKDSDGQPLFLDRQNIPAIVDLDCDRRLDLFIGRVEGHVTRYEADAPGSEHFALIAERFEGIEIVGRGSPAFAPSFPMSFGEAGPSARHGANALAFADFDGDKDLDLFWGDFFEQGMLLIENIGRTCSSPSFQIEPVQMPFADGTRTSGYNAPAPVDFDGDGDLDFFMGVLGGSFNPVMTSADNFYHWERVAPDRFELRSRRFLSGIDLGSEVIPAVADLDGDGDLDLIAGNKIDAAGSDAARLVVFTNEGTTAAPRFRQGAPLKLVDAFHAAPAFGDLDGDGDLDLLLGTWNQDVRFFRNQGTSREPKWVEEPANAIHPPRVSSAAPALADIDGDKDLDLFVGQATGAITFYRNDGTVKAPKFTLVSERMDDIHGGRRSVPALVDLDGDGLLDLVVGREAGGAGVYRNAGTKTSPKFVEFRDLTLALPPMSAPVFADLTGDGVADLISGTASGGIVFFRGVRR